MALSLEEAKDDSSSAIIRKTDAGVDLRLSGQEIALTVLQPFLDVQSVRPRAGTVTVDVTLSGPIESLQGNGSLRFAGGEVELPMQNVVYEDISLEVLLEGDRARIPQLALRSEKGTLSGSGEVAMSERKLGDARLQLKADEFRAVDAADLHLTLSGDLELTRTSDALRLTGKLTLDHLEYFLDPAALNRDEREIVLTDADRAMLIEAFGPSVTAERSTFLRDALDIAEIDVTVRAEQNAWIRQRSEPRLAAELAGTVQAKKAPKGPFEFFGELRPVPGRGFVEQYGRRFELASGEVILNGDPARTHFRIESTYEVVPIDDPSGTEVVATLTLSGTPGDYDLDLSSDQGLSSSEITTLIVTGSTGTGGGVGSDRGQVAAGTAVQASLTSVTGAVEEIAGEAIGLDVFQIRQDGLNGATLIAGKYARPKFYVGLRQPMLYQQEDLTDPSEDRDVELELEYTASKRLQVNLRGEGDALRFFLRTSQAY
jgi:autotransporter translocation and assembly factor TamB